LTTLIQYSPGCSPAPQDRSARVRLV
jgi:hypothetical protein